MKDNDENRGNNFSDTIGEKEQLRLKGQHNKRRVWSGFGLFGMIGWSVAVPALLGVALGIWLDKRYPRGFSWTLTCFFTGLITGCIIAWKWVNKEDKEIHTNRGKDNE